MEIVPAFPEDYDEIVALFKQYKFALQERNWYDWKYFENPLHQGLTYKMVQGSAIVGAVAILPQDFYYQGRKLTGLQTVDGLMGKEIRGKHLFNDVMAFLLENRPEGLEDDYFYLSFPSLKSSVAAHENAGWQRLAGYSLYSCFLSAKVLNKANRAGGLISGLATPVWPLYLKMLFKDADSQIKVERLSEFPEDLGHLTNDQMVCGDRSKLFMDWRVCNNPKDDLVAYSLQKPNGDVCYLVCKISGRNYEIIDRQFKQPDKASIATFLKYLHTNNLADSVDFWVLGARSRPKDLPGFGMVHRDAGGVLFVKGIQKAELPQDPAQWAVTYLDSDW